MIESVAPSQTAAAERRRRWPVTLVWIGFVLLVTYGSLFPFDFHMRELDEQTILSFIASCCSRFSRGDAVGNVVLFLPIGFFGVLTHRPGRSAGYRLVSVGAVGVILALALQVAQFYLPERVPSVQDAIWNTFGTFAGAVTALWLGRRLGRGVALRNLSGSLAPLALIGAWLAYRLVPFVPSIDLQAIKTSLKPLLLHPAFDMAGMIHDAAAWLVVAFLLRTVWRRDGIAAVLPLLILATFGLEVLIVDNAISLTNVAGAGVAVLLWWAVLGRLQAPAAVLAVLLAVAIATSALSPFLLLTQPADFRWIPFSGFLGGSMFVNAQAACEKAFLYGSLVYLLGQTRLNRTFGLVLAVVFIAALEVAQRWIHGRLPEVTDPLLVVLMAAVLLALQKLAPEDAAAVGSVRTSAGRRR